MPTQILNTTLPNGVNLQPSYYNGGAVNTFGKTSVGRLMTEQLNQFASITLLENDLMQECNGS